MLNEKGVVGIVGPYHQEQTKAISSVTSRLGIPNISPTASGVHLEDPLNLRFMFHLTPIDSKQVEPVLGILKMLGLQDSPVALINTDDAYGLGLRSTFEVRAHQLGVVIRQYVIIPASTMFPTKLDLGSKMKQLKEQRIRVFIMFVSVQFVRPILEQADAAGLIGPEYLWISGSSASQDLDNHQNKQPVFYDGLLLISQISNDETEEYLNLRSVDLSNFLPV
eukprot:sb/3469773/